MRPYSAEQLDFGPVTIPLQRVGGCRENFTVNVGQSRNGSPGVTGYMTGEPERTRYAPGVHAFQ